MSKTLQAIKFDRASWTLEVLDQLVLPHATSYIRVEGIDDAFSAIASMQVRGAPAIAIVGAFAIVLESKRLEGSAKVVELLEKIKYLFSSRPTAVNLGNAIDGITTALNRFKSQEIITPEATKVIYDYAIKLYDDDLANNHHIGDNGLEYIRKSLEAENFTGPFSIMTICNTGSLATSGHGTALGIVRTVHKRLSDRNQKFWLEKVYPCETRPYNQGSRLTTYELDYEGIPFSLICDNMVSSLISSLDKGNKIKGSSAPVKFIIVGADRIVKNGDTANKIGTFQLATIANYFNGVPGSQKLKFIVAAPKTTIDIHSKSGDEIKIEERPDHEMTTIKGAVLENGQVGDKKTVAIATPNISVWNPAFDVTPYQLIDSIVTEKDVLTKDSNGEFRIEQ